MPTRTFVLEGEPRRFWDISWEGSAVEITSGKWGTNGRVREAKFNSADERDAFIAAEVKKIEKKGYHASEGVAPAPDGDAKNARLVADLRARIEARRRKAWRPIFEPGTQGIGVVRGPMSLDPDEAWPTCAVCGGELTGLFELDLALVPAADLRSDSLVQLFWCEAWEMRGDSNVCSTESGSWLARRRARAASKRPGPARPRGTGPFAIVRFEPFEELPPRKGDLEERFETAPQEVIDDLLRSVGATIDPRDEYRAVVDALGLSPRNEHKLGGVPTFVQDHERPFLQQIFQIEQSAPFDVNFGDVGAGHLLLLEGGGVDFTWASH